ncbi:MAG TPA: aminodeoxychorismate synthase component I [Bacteroidales bacterium]|jgi:para-aminobenzoate synthetase component 1|nr:aminodeoxychorismate synthase component I [Bacteroidales bacterium]
MINKSEAISIMNTMGGKRTPFIFIIDFEMKDIMVFRLDMPLPQAVLCEFPGFRKSESTVRAPVEFIFCKFPVQYEEYHKAFAMIQKEIHAGNTFLANLTFPTLIETNLSLREIYKHCRAKYKILVYNRFVCFSPETFIRINNDVISTYPMKGTINSAINDADEKILGDNKELAEHCTIVDLLRNDLSQFSLNVKVDRFRYIERIQRHEGELLQVSSEISGKMPKGYRDNLGEIIFSLLPAGSVTGAPKRETLNIITRVEKAERGYYTGICGIYDGNNLDSAVLIRFIENNKGKLQFRSGGGITFLSEAFKEYQELIDKVYVPIIRNN